jgi:hypothetical protein
MYIVDGYCIYSFLRTNIVPSNLEERKHSWTNSTLNSLPIVVGRGDGRDASSYDRMQSCKNHKTCLPYCPLKLTGKQAATRIIIPKSSNFFCECVLVWNYHAVPTHPTPLHQPSTILCLLYILLTALWKWSLLWVQNQSYAEYPLCIACIHSS